MTNRKKAFDISQFPQDIIEKFSTLKSDLKLAIGGIDADTLAEPVAKYNKAPGEVVYENENGASISLKRDRTAGLDSGYGGRGDSQCATIDLCVGLGAGKELYDSSGNKIDVDPDFISDPARIYISQKTDIDSAFGLATGSYGESKTKSAVAIKADGIRLISRENTKIVAGIDDKNSQGANRRGYYGIELIANNDDTTLQSMPLGDNLVECLTDLSKRVDELGVMLEIVIRNQILINSTLAAHVHLSSAPGTPSSPSVELAVASVTANSQLTTAYKDVISNKINIVFFKLNYLMKFGYKYINSRFNKVN